MLNLNNLFVPKSKPNEFISYSLEGEDCLLNRYFKEKGEGFYIDIGAHHPFRFNNTYFFYKKGWRGINVDADKKAIEMFDKLRKDDVNLLSAVGSNNSKMTFYEFNEPALNTFDKKLVNEYKSLGYKVTNKRNLKFSTLKSLLDDNLPNNQKIDFISIDVEGFEMRVLESNDWGKYRPEILLVEVLNTNTLTDAINCKISKYLKSRKYSIVAKTLTNVMYKNILINE